MQIKPKTKMWAPKTLWHLLVTFLLSSCASLVGDLRETYAVDLQHGFYGSRVEVLADDRVVYRGTVTTDSSSGLAHSIPATGPCFTITVKVRHQDGKTFVRTTRPNRRAGCLVGVNADVDGLRFMLIDGNVNYY